MTEETTDIRPQIGPQMQFLTSSADIAIYGGAAGGGKTFALLLDPLRYVNNPKFGFVIFRRTSPQITNEGGLWDESKKLYPNLNAEGLSGISTWRFPGGSKGAFRHLQHKDTVLNWQGAQIPYIGFDELTHFEESQFFYMLSRNRSTCGVRPCIRATTNPSPGWVKKFLAPWLDKGFPNPAESAEIRWFIRKDGQIEWVDADYRDADGQPAKSVTFVRSTIYDNKILLDANPEYLTNLRSLPAVEQARLLHGDWDVFEGAFFDEWSESVHTETPPFSPRALPSHWNYFGGLDWGYSDKSAFAFLLLAADQYGTVHVIDEIWRQKLTNEEMAVAVCSLLSKWGVPKDIPIACDTSMWSPTRTVTGYNGEKDIEAFWRAGLSGCATADKDRQAGWSQVRRFLHTEGAFKVWKGYCKHLIEQFPLMTYDDKKDNDMETESDDHLHDALRYALMTRPNPSVAPKTLEQIEHEFQEQTNRARYAHMIGHKQQGNSWKV